MAIITVDKLSLAFGHTQLLDHISLALEKNDKYGLIGRNGAGKSSLLKVLAREVKADDGKIHYQDGLKVIYVAQEPLLNSNFTVFQELMAGLGKITHVLTEYYHTLELLAQNHDLLDKLNQLQHDLEHTQAWSIKNQIDKTLTELGLDGNWLIAELSGGVRKKVALAKALVASPDVMLLDEPTNHLDVNAIEWLEGILNNYKGALILITHDRRFLDNTIDQILELDRGSLRSYSGNFARYQEIKARQLADEAKTNAEFDKFLAQEEVWIRKGIEARRTRNEGRVRRLFELRNLRKSRREQLGRVNLQIDSGNTAGKIVAEIQDLSLAFADKVIVKNFSATITRGEKIGLIGSNGIGKTSLLKTILGEITATSGKVKLGTNLSIAYFDQLRQQLDENKTIQEVIADGQDFVFVNGARKHVATYLEEFLFAPARFRSPVASLSGGERNRLLLAKLFAQPANVLVLDEPTNDLDVDTLELLEELLANYAGTVFLVSHDREFLDNVVTQSWVFLGDGEILQFSGGYTDWINYKPQYLQLHANTTIGTKQAKRNDSKEVIKKTSHKLSYKETQELNKLPELLAKLEQEQIELNLKLQDAELYKNNPQLVNQYSARISELEELLLLNLARWEELEARSK